MAIIPRAQPNLDIDPLPQVRNTARVEPVRGIAQAASGFADAALAYHQREVERNDVTALMQARRELSDWEAQTFDPENPSGIGAYRGQNALAANEKLLPDLDRKLSDISTRLTPQQRARFDELALGFRDSIATRLNGHMQREHETFLQAEQKAALDNLTNDATQAALDGNFGLAATRAQELILMRGAFLRAQGMPEELIRAEERNIVSTVHGQVVEGMLVRDPLQAQAYYDRYADQIAATDRARIERALQPYVEDAQAEAVAGDILSGVVGGGMSASQGNYAEMRRKLESGGNPRAFNKASGAAGPDQFLASTWMSLVRQHQPAWAKGLSEKQLLDARFDPEKSAEMAAHFDRANAAELEKRGLPVDNMNLYLAHHFGAAGAAAIIRAPANTPMQKLVDAKAYRANPHLHGKTKAEVLSDFARRAGLPDDAAGIRIGTPPATEDEALAMVRQDPRTRDPRVRQAAEQKVRQQWSQRKQDLAELERAGTEAVYLAVEQADPRTPLRTILGPQFEFAARNGLLDDLERRLDQRRKGDLVQDNLQLADTLRRQAVTNPTGFARLPLAKYATQLSVDTLEELAEKQKALQKPDARAEFATEAEALKALVYGPLKLTGDDPATKERRAAFDRAWYGQKRSWMARTGKQPSAEERDGLLRKLTATFVLDGEERPFYEAGARGQVPTQFAEQIREALRARGVREPTEEQIRKVYLIGISQ